MTITTDTSPPHAPALGFTQRLLGRFHVTGVFWYQFPYIAFTRWPRWIERPSKAFFTVFFFLTMPKIRAAIGANLEPVLGKTNRLGRWKRGFRTMYDFAGCLVDKYRHLSIPEKFRTVLEGEEHWRALLDSGKGAVLVTAHIGMWEVAARGGDALKTRRIHVVREQELDPRAQEFTRSVLVRGGEDIVTHFAGDDPALSLKLAEALKRGELVAFQGDRPRSGGRSVTSSIFERPMPLPVGPASLARAADVPLVPVFNFREGHRVFRAVVRRPIEVAHTNDREADIAAAMHRFAAEVEWAIRERPHQWFCFRRLWD